MYESIELDLDARVNCFIGRNGVGKTNLLDAIHYLCIGKSYFNPLDTQNIHYGSSFFRIEGSFRKGDEVDHMVVINEKGKRKELIRNKVTYERMADHIGHYPVVVIAPDDLELINGGSDERRRFVDYILCFLDREYLDALVTYNKLLQQRNAALKQFAEQRRFDRSLLKVYEERMIPPGTNIFEKRKEFVKAFVPLFEEKYRRISQGIESVGINYHSDLNKCSFEELLQKNLERDKVLQRTDVGIHKDDLKFSIDEHNLKKFGSQGQKKTFLISLKMTQYDYLFEGEGIKPLLLLDDLSDKLDPQRAGELIALSLEDQVGQVFITDTQEERLDSFLNMPGIEVKIFKLDKGKLAEHVET